MKTMTPGFEDHLKKMTKTINKARRQKKRIPPLFFTGTVEETPVGYLYSYAIYKELSGSSNTNR